MLRRAKKSRFSRALFTLFSSSRQSRKFKVDGITCAVEHTFINNQGIIFFNNYQLSLLFKYKLSSFFGCIGIVDCGECVL